MNKKNQTGVGLIEVLITVLVLSTALMALAALMRWRLPPWLVVLGCAGGGWLIAAVG